MQTAYKVLPWVAGAMLLLAIPDGMWPYAYYQVLRWVVCAAGIALACEAFTHDRQGWTWTMGILAVVFNPIVPFYLEKETWVIIDLVAAGIMFAYAVVGRNK